MTEGGRAQDQERSHKRKGRPSAETRKLLNAWQDALRAELRGIVAALEETKAPGLLPGPPELAIALEDPRRDRFVDRGVKIARELGASIDDAPDPEAAPTPARPSTRKRKIDFGGA